MPKNDARDAVERLLDDPIVDLILARDGLTRADVRRVIETVRNNLRARMPEQNRMPEHARAPSPRVLDRAA